MSTRTDVYTPVMGTVLELTVGPADLAEPVGQAVLAEVARLSAVLSGHDETSALSRWRRGETDVVPAELAEVLHAAAHLHRVTAGAFHAGLGPVIAAWRRAEASGVMPTPERMRRLAVGLGVPGTDREAIEADGLAKGYVVDAALRMGLATARSLRDDPEAVTVTVNAGGDLRHGGAGERRVRIENPLRPFDNAAPLDAVTIRDAALATSGTARRGVRVGKTWLGHVIDPRTGWPVNRTLSASVIAPSAMTADAVATAALVLHPAAALDLASGLGLAALLVTPDGATHRTANWPTGPH